MDINDIIEYQRSNMRLKLEKFIMLNLKMDYMPGMNENAIIYGAGVIGKLLYRCYDRKPVAFLDAKQGLRDICGAPVYCINDCTKEHIKNGSIVIVTPIWAYEEIASNIYKINPDVSVVSLEKLVEQL